jgi:CheY-like chemotaxis protein
MGKRILVVDDEPDIREVARISLQAIGGYDVIDASSGAEALEVAASQRPDAILLDVMMPGLDGPSTFARLQQDDATRDIPVLLLTAKVGEAERSRLAQTGVKAVLGKPFDPMQLPGEVASALGWA